MQYNTQCLWKLVHILVKQCFLSSECSLGKNNDQAKGKKNRKKKDMTLRSNVKRAYTVTIRFIFRFMSPADI